MSETLFEKQDELRMRMRKYDEAILKMINGRTRDTILKIIKDYLSQHES